MLHLKTTKLHFKIWVYERTNNFHHIPRIWIWKEKSRSYVHCWNFCKNSNWEITSNKLNVFIVLAGHHMVTDCRRATMCRWKLKPHHWKHRIWEKCKSSKTYVFWLKTNWRFNFKNFQLFSSCVKTSPHGA